MSLYEDLTEILTPYADKINQNTASLDDLRDDLDNLDVETDKTLSVDGKPADAKAVGDIISAMQSFKKVKNFETYQGFITATGSISTQDATRQEVYTNLISIDEGETLHYTFAWAQSNNQWAAIAKYNSNREFLSRQIIIENISTNSYSSSFTQSDDVAYVVFTYRTYGDVQLSVFTDWVEMIQLYNNLSEVSDKTAQNESDILDMQTIISDSAITITGVKDVEKSLENLNLCINKDSELGYLSNTGNLTVGSNGERTTDYIAVSEGDVLNIRNWGDSGTSKMWFGLCKYDTDKTFISRSTSNESAVGVSYYQWVYTVPSGVAFVRVSARFYGKMMITKGDFDMAYLPSSEDIYAVTGLTSQVGTLETKVESLREGIKVATGTESINYSDGYIATNASTININDVRASNIYKCAVSACAEGDTFHIIGHSGSAAYYQLWAFIDANGTKIKNSGVINYDSLTTIKAPATATYLVSNIDKAYDYALYKGELVAERLSEYESVTDEMIIDLTSNSRYEYNYGYVAVNASTVDINNTHPTNTSYKCVVIPCTEGDTFSLKGKSGTSTIYSLWTFVDANSNKLTYSGIANYTEYTVIKAPANASYFVSNVDVNYPYGLYSGDLLANRVSTLESEMGSIAPTGLNNPLLKPCSPRVAMHRGFNTQAPENTIPAFELAGQAGAWAIETDIYETTDGYFVISHDNDVSRMTDGTGKITEMTYAQTQECTIDAGANIEQYTNLKMPTLQEYLSICRRYGCVAFVEIKGITHYDALVDAIRKAGMEGSIVFLCYYSLSEVNTIRTYTGAPIALLGSVNSDLTTLTDHAAENVDVWIDIYSTTVATEVLEYAHSKNVPVAGWTYSSTSGADTAFRRGLDIVTAEGFAKLPTT